MKLSHRAPAVNLNATTLPSKQLEKNIDNVNLHVIKKDLSHHIYQQRLISPSITSMIFYLNYSFIHKRFVQASHQRIIQMSKLGIYTGLQKSTRKLSQTFWTCLISKGTHLFCHPNVSTEHIDPCTIFHLELGFFNKVSCQKITSVLTIVDATTRHLFGYPTR